MACVCRMSFVKAKDGNHPGVRKRGWAWRKTNHSVSVQWNSMCYNGTTSMTRGGKGTIESPGLALGRKMGRCLMSFFFRAVSQVHSKIEHKVQKFPLYPLLVTHMHGLPRYPNTHQNGTFVTTREPTLTHCYHPEPTVDIRVHSVGLRSLWVWTNAS